MSEKNRKNPWKTLFMSGLVSLVVACYFFYSAKTLEKSALETFVAMADESIAALEDKSFVSTITLEQLSALERKQKNAKHISMGCFGIGIVLVSLGIRLQRLDLSRG